MQSAVSSPPHPSLPLEGGGQGRGCKQSAVTAKQIKKIHTLTSKLKMPDDEYRYLLSDYWVETSKKLSYSEAQDLIRKLEKIAIEKGVWSQYGNRGKMRYEDLKDRHGMASPKQLRKIEAMWKDVSYTHKIDERARALRKFIFRIVGVDDMRMLESIQARKVIEALQHMRKVKFHNQPIRDRSINW